MERWKAIEGYEGLYEVSDMGNVKSLRSGKNLVKGTRSNGYEQVGLCRNSKKLTIAVHRLVGLAFCEGYSEGLHINHIDGTRNNNVATNLEWVTQKENNRDVWRRGANKASEKRIKFRNLKSERYVECLDRNGNVLAVFPSLSSAARALGLEVGNIKRVCDGERSQTGGFGWRKITR